MSSREKRRRGRRPWRLVARAAVGLTLGSVLLVAGGLGSVARADDGSDARRHAQRATSLAASGKCKQAVVEFDKALAILRDPALLFNRAECHRKLGDAEAAIDDYKQFLSDMPKAPNRAQVEKRIAELQRPAPGAGAAGAPAASGAGPGNERPAHAPVATAQSRERTEPRPSPASGTSAPSSRSEPPSTPSAEQSPAREVILTPPPAADTDHAGAALTTASDSAPASSSDGGVASRPWFWIAVAVLAVGVGVGTFVVLNRDSTSVPSSALGNYKF